MDIDRNFHNCAFCGSRLISFKDFKNFYNYRIFMYFGKCQKCQDWEDSHPLKDEIDTLYNRVNSLKNSSKRNNKKKIESEISKTYSKITKLKEKYNFELENTAIKTLGVKRFVQIKRAYDKELTKSKSNK